MDAETHRAEERSLVERVLRRDRKATAEFVDTYSDAVYSFVRWRLTPRFDLVDDLVQEVFLAAWEGLTKYQGDSSLKNWLLGIARHKVEDHYRNVLRSPASLNAEEVNEMPSSDPDWEHLAEQDRTEWRVRQILSDLPERYSTALQWRYWEKRSARDMAQATGRSEKAIERLLARAREEFRRRWIK